MPDFGNVLNQMLFMWAMTPSASADTRSSGEDAQVRGELARAGDQLLAMHSQVDRLTLACAAMWSLLKQHGHTEEELLAAMQALDMRDGRIDGKLPAPPRICAACKRKSAAVRASCLYCGAKLPDAGAFGTDV